MEDIPSNAQDSAQRLSPLRGDISRQAIPSLRGYVYQIVRTTLAWLELLEDEIIVVEGAEDFDRISFVGGIAHQVKDLSDNITLRSASVVDSIQNLWNLKRDNLDRKVELRFLTTAQPGVENGKPFGIPGILFWNKLHSVKYSASIDADIRVIVKFLETRCFSDDLSEFLREANEEDVHRLLIAPLRFDTALDRTDRVEEMIRDYLINLGERYGVPPAEAEMVSDTLFAEVLRIATGPGARVLTRALLCRLFQEKTMKTVPRADFERHQRTVKPRQLADFTRWLGWAASNEEAWDKKFYIQIVLGNVHSVEPIEVLMSGTKGESKSVRRATRIWLQIPLEAQRVPYSVADPGVIVASGDFVAIAAAFLAGSNSNGHVVGFVNLSAAGSQLITVSSVWNELYPREVARIKLLFGGDAAVSILAGIQFHSLPVSVGSFAVILLAAYVFWFKKQPWPLSTARHRVREVLEWVEQEYRTWLSHAL